MMNPNITADEIRQLIRSRAHERWESEGKPGGKEQEHWLAAQKEVMEEVDRSGAAGPANPALLEPRSHDGNERQEDLLDEAIEESFPASDPITPKRIT